MPDLPPYLSKYLKMTPAALSLADDDRLCPLDSSSTDVELVYDARIGAFTAHEWSQAYLLKMARKDTNIHLARIPVTGMDITLRRRDLFNDKERAQREKAGEKDLNRVLLFCRVGYFVARDRKYVYLVSRRETQTTRVDYSQMENMRPGKRVTVRDFKAQGLHRVEEGESMEGVEEEVHGIVTMDGRRGPLGG
ncbi:hypothetical protein EJ06DRAFT_559586 [Trichodelitschia bisporula]|uniref:Uncharacterized protein n=1 Tax=Trichodelitschia bisporula TaxID=703511 RepID=A0A6G1HLN6_9PEZI|nr:hypothetical protein EJ06DRAFT_559586 [Trichodelitschia bisporula]